MSKRRREAMERQSEAEAHNTTISSATGAGPGWRNLSWTQRSLMLGVMVFLSIGVMGMALKYLEESAKEQKANAKNNSVLAALNPFSPPPTPTPTPLPLSKQYIYAGSRLLAVKDAGVDVVAPSDLAVWRPSSGVWCVLGNQMTIETWGEDVDVPTPGDYDGDGRTDFCIFRPNRGDWYVWQSSDNSQYVTHFGMAGDQAAQADYDGDGKTDLAVLRPDNQYWYILKSSNSEVEIDSLGGDSDIKVPADYDGDGKSDLAVWRNNEERFYVKRSTERQTVITHFGQEGDQPVIGDYDGDGRADLATWRGSDNKWRILQSSNNQIITVQWGVQSTDIAVPADYDADGKCDIAIWRSSGTYAGYWYILKSSTGQARIELWGIEGDIPVPSRYRR